MTRLTEQSTGKGRVLRRVVVSESGEAFVLEMKARTLTIRPRFTRRPDAAVVVTWAAIYQREMIARAKRATPRRRMSRGLL